MLDPSREVADPTTSAERLAEIAAQHPELGMRIAAHPNCYPELRQWIAQYATQIPPMVFTETKRNPGRKFWTRTKIIFSGGLALVGAVTGVISVIPIITRDATNFSHLEIVASPVLGEVSEWAIPAEALDLEFPISDRACGADQITWLEENAEPLQRSFMLNARNVANEGAMLALTEFRATVNGNEDRGEVKVRFVCDPSGVMPELLYYGKLTADDPDREAVHVKLETQSAPNSSPEMPVAFNLAPGESGKIPLDLFARTHVQGSFQVTVLSRDEKRVVNIPGSEFDMPALLFGGEMFLFTSADGVSCHRVETGMLAACTVDELRQEVGQAQ